MGKGEHGELLKLHYGKGCTGGTTQVSTWGRVTMGNYWRLDMRKGGHGCNARSHFRTHLVTYCYKTLNGHDFSHHSIPYN